MLALFSSASLGDNRTQTLSASLGTGVLKRLLQRCTWHQVLFFAAAHNSSVKIFCPKADVQKHTNNTLYVHCEKRIKHAKILQTELVPVLDVVTFKGVL